MAPIPFPIPLPQQAPRVSPGGPFSSFASSPTLRPNSRDPAQQTWQRNRGTQRLQSSKTSSHSKAQLQKLFHNQEAPPSEKLGNTRKRGQSLRAAPLPPQAPFTDTDLLSVILPVKRTLLLALLAGVRRSVLLFGVRAALALVSNERCDYVAVLAGFGL